MKLEHFIFFVLPMILGFSSIIACVLYNIYKIYKHNIAEKEFIKFLKRNEQFQLSSNISPSIFSLTNYLTLFSIMLDESDVDPGGKEVIFDGITQKYPACLNYMKKLWYKGKVNKCNCLSCMEEEL